jgi:hypothetical protein
MFEKLFSNLNSNSSLAYVYDQLGQSQQFAQLLSGESCNLTVQGSERFMNRSASCFSALLQRRSGTRFRCIYPGVLKAIPPWGKALGSKAART